jgi:hypothetical protein
MIIPTGLLRIRNKAQVVITGITCIKTHSLLNLSFKQGNLFYYKERRKEIQSKHLQHFLFFLKKKSVLNKKS